MLISELIKYLEEQKEIHGDIPVCHSESHEYWGSVQTHLTTGYNIAVYNNSQPDGPKKPGQKCVQIGE